MADKPNYPRGERSLSEALAKADGSGKKYNQIRAKL